MSRHISARPKERRMICSNWEESQAVLRYLKEEEMIYVELLEKMNLPDLDVAAWEKVQSKICIC